MELSFEKLFKNIKIQTVFITFLLNIITIPLYAYDAYIDGIYYDFSKSGWQATVVEGNTKYSGEVIIPGVIYYNNISYSVTSIGPSAFASCPELTSITIPNSITSIGSSAFFGSFNLLSVHITSIEAWCNIYFNESWSNPLIEARDMYLNGKIITELDIPETVDFIHPYAFYGWKNLKSVHFSNSVYYIANYAFYNCSSLTSINIPNSVTNIGSKAFQKCKKVRDVYIGSGVIKIESGAFSDCDNLYSFYCYAPIPPQAEFAISNNAENATLFVPKESLELYKTAGKWREFGVILPFESENEEQCAIPNMSYTNGELHFDCSTPNAKCYYQINAADTKDEATYAANNTVSLYAYYDIKYYAKAEGYRQSSVGTATLYWLNANLETDNINQAQTRGIVVSSDNGIISVSGLDNNEKVSFYSTKGMVLGSQKAIDGRVSYAVGTAQKIIIVKIGDNSIKVMNQ